MRKIGMLIFLLQFVCLSIQAQPRETSSTITIRESSISVGEVLAEITRQSGLDFSFNATVVNPDQLISFSVRRASLEKTLEVLAKKLNVECHLVEDQIVLNLPAQPIKEKEVFFTLSGFISDEASGESLIGATVSVPGTAKGAVTNAFGYYSFQVEPGSYQLQYSYVGYEWREIAIKVEQDIKRNIALKTTSIELPKVVVGLPIKKIKDRSAGQLELSPKALSNMPEFAGESGLVKSLQSLPGISMHSDGSSFFYTRGGERDQNLIIVDDAPIYNPMHLFGFYSMIIPDFTKSVEIYKSDIPTSLGDRLSSIINIRTKDGNLNKLEFRGALNPLIYRFSLETPVAKKKGSIFTSFRRSNFEWLYKQSVPNADLNFGDFSFKWNHKIGDKDRVYLTTIWSGDNFVNSNTGGIRWTNAAATLRWNHIFGPKLFSNTTIYTGSYNYRLFFSANHWQSGIGTLSFKSDFTHYARPGYKSKFGLEAQGYFIDPGSFSLDTTFAILPDIKPNYSRKLALYYEGEWDINSRLRLKAGVRMLNWANRGPATYYLFDNQYQVRDTIETAAAIYNDYSNFDPRLSLRYQLDSSALLKLSFGVYHQYLQLISNSVSPFSSFEVWLPAGPNIRPQSSMHWALNYLKYFEKTGFEFSSSVYYKKFNHQIDYKDHPVILLNPLLEGELRFGFMHAYGIEFLLKKDLGRLNGWMGYTYSRAIRKTPDLNGGRTYPAFQDRPHDFSMMINYRFASQLHFSAYYTIYSGSTFSSPTGFYTFNSQTVPIYEEKNNDRLPTYQRFDFALKLLLNKREEARFQHSLTFSIYNALSHKNIVTVDFNRIPREGERPVVKANVLNETALTATQSDLIRFFPSLTYKFKI